MFRTQQDWWILHAIKVIYETYGVKVSVDAKNKDLLKYGESLQVQTTSTTLMTLPTGTYNETYVNRNLITHISSSSANDTGVIKIEGHTVGDDLSVSSLTQAAGVATCTTSVAHNLSNDEWVNVEGANETEYNGIVQVTVTGASTFTYTVDSGATSPATGTIITNSQNKTFVVQEKTLQGQTKIALDTPLARSSRTFVPSQNRATNTEGDIYVYEDDTVASGVPDTDSKVHLIQPANRNQSEKASTSLSSEDFWIVQSYHAHIFTKQSSFANVILQKREVGGVFRGLDNIAVSSNTPTVPQSFLPYEIIAANSDVRLIGLADVDNRNVGGSIDGVLAKVIG